MNNEDYFKNRSLDDTIQFLSLFSNDLKDYPAFQELEIKNVVHHQSLDDTRTIKNDVFCTSNIKRLAPTWLIRTKTPVSAKPIVEGNCVYFTDWSGVAYCADSQNGAILWKIKVYNPSSLPPYFWTGLAGTGVIKDGIWYIASVGSREEEAFKNASPGKLYAIDLNTQKVLWGNTLSSNAFSGSISALTTYEDLVIVGISSVDEAAYAYALQAKIPFEAKSVGEVRAYHQKTGQLVWKKPTIGLKPLDNLKAHGASVWGSFAIDPIRQTLYFGTGNNFGEPASLSSDALVALNVNNGQFKWQNQVVEGDTWLPGDDKHTDDDFGTGPQLFCIEHNQESIDSIGIGSKDGYYYCFNRNNGNLIWSKKIYTGEDSGSGIRGNASVRDGRIYVWSNNGYDEEDQPKPNEFPITVMCLDANTGNTIWESTKQPAAAISAGVLVNDLFMVGDLTGSIYAYRITDGKIVWKYTIKDTSIASDLTVDQQSLYVGCGVPSLFGGSTDQCGVACFRLK